MSNKIANDKYYTPSWLAEYIYSKTKEILDIEINEIIEPSAGNGVFLDIFKEKTIAYDLYPENDNIIQADYLKTDLKYKKGRVVIGNPPFGKSGNLARQFILKSLKHSDYVAFILPAGFYNSENIKGLIYSEYLDIVDFSNRKVKVCFNIYSKKEYENKINNKNKENDYLSDVEIVFRNRSNKNTKEYYDKRLLKDFDFAICRFGSAGKIVEYDNQFCNYILFRSKDKEKIKIIKNIIKNTNFKNNKKYFPYSSSPTISKGRLIKYLNDKLREYYND